MEKLLKSAKHWQIAVIGLLGAWLSLSPWVLGAAQDTRVVGAGLVLGLALVAAAVVMTRPGHASCAAWSGLVVGLVTAVSPWLLGHADDMTHALNAVATGIAAAALSCMVGFQVVDPDHWWSDRVAR